MLHFQFHNLNYLPLLSTCAHHEPKHIASAPFQEYYYYMKYIRIENMYQLLNYNIDVVDVATSEAEEVTQVCFDMWQGMGRVDLIESMLHADWLIIPFMRYGIEDL